MKTAEPVRPTGVLQQNRVFLDFFWDIAKPEQEVRLKAVEDLIQYLKKSDQVRGDLTHTHTHTHKHTAWTHCKVTELVSGLWHLTLVTSVVVEEIHH